MRTPTPLQSICITLHSFIHSNLYLSVASYRGKSGKLLDESKFWVDLRSCVDSSLDIYGRRKALREDRSPPQQGQDWRHYKGGLRCVIDIAEHTETSETMVVYTCQGAPGRRFARPLSLWMGQVEVPAPPPTPIRLKAGSPLAQDLPRMREIAAEVATWDRRHL